MALVAQRRAAAHDHAAVRQPAQDLGLVAVAQRDPGEVGLAVTGGQAALVQLVPDVQAFDGDALHAPLHLVLVAQRLDGRHLRQGVYRERLAHAVHRQPEVLGAQGVAHPQPAEPVDLREGAQQDQVGVAVGQWQRLVGVLERGELHVGLVEDHAHVARQPGDERVDRLDRKRRGGRVVGVADEHDPGCGRHLARHRLQVVTPLGV